jgi:threonine synthase
VRSGPLEQLGAAAQFCIEPRCGACYGINERLYECSACGGLLTIGTLSTGVIDVHTLPAIWEARQSSHEARDRSGVWRFRELLPFGDDVPVVTLEEGNTPLYEAPRSASYCRLDALRLKHQGCNPTGSFKDTGMTTAVTQARLLGARTVLCASTGNTAASLAAYSARANLQCAILIPRGQVSHGKLAQSLDYGARVFEIEGNFDDCMRLARELAEEKSIYLVNSINPFRIEGQKIVAAELLEQCNWQVPDHVVVPGGNLGNSTALGKGFIELLELGLIKSLPRLSVIQAEGAAPFARLFDDGDLERFATEAIPDELFAPVAQPQTLASAIKIGAPVSWKKSLRAVLRTGGHVISVSEREVADAKAVIGLDGIGCEPASATTVAGMRQLVASGHINPGDDVVGVLTGHVLKDTDYTIDYHRQKLYAVTESAKGAKEKRRLVSSFSNSTKRVRASKTIILRHLEKEIVRS